MPRQNENSTDLPDPGRRELLRAGFAGLGMLATANMFTGCRSASMYEYPVSPTRIPDLGPLNPPDKNGIRLPKGFTSRIVARSGQEPVRRCGYVWHAAPDGGATFPDGKGWIYVSNSEAQNGGGGVGALRFDSRGRLKDSYQILSDTTRNCAGGPTPWGTWLSCEEHAKGLTWECDPHGRNEAVRLPALGVFSHEAVTYDPDMGYFYLTEDVANGLLYRFLPAAYDETGIPDMHNGTLQCAQVFTGGKGDEGLVLWHDVPDASAKETSTRLQVKAATPFVGGEGIWHHEGTIYFATKGDNRIWAYNTSSRYLDIIYDAKDFEKAELTGVDNVMVSPGGDIIVAEDGGDMQLMAITPGGKLVPMLQVIGQKNSEICGQAFDPSFTRLYFSSQRGKTGKSSGGITYEISGPFMA